MFALYDRNQSYMPMCMDDVSVTWIQAILQSHGSTWENSWIPHSTLWIFFSLASGNLLSYITGTLDLPVQATAGTSSIAILTVSFFFWLYDFLEDHLSYACTWRHSLLSGSFLRHCILLKIWTDCTSNKLGEDLPVLAHITGSWPKRFCLLSVFFHHRVDWHASFSGMVTLSIDLSKHLETVELKWRFV